MRRAARRGRGDERTGALVELVMEYDPAPPYGTGHPERAPAELVEAVRSMV